MNKLSTKDIFSRETLKRKGRERSGEDWRVTVYTDKVTAEVKKGRGERIKGWRRGKYSGRVYRYATAPAINIAGKVDAARAESEVRQWRRSWAWHLQWNEERILRLPPAPFSSTVSSPSLAAGSPHNRRCRFLFPPRCTPLDSAVVEVHFIPTFNKASRPLRGFIKNWGCNSPRGRAGGTV